VHHIDPQEAKNLARAIRDDRNPTALMEALALRGQWLIQNDCGALQMSPEVRNILEGATAVDSETKTVR
jgi:hypothetical protein